MVTNFQLEPGRFVLGTYKAPAKGDVEAFSGIQYLNLVPADPTRILHQKAISIVTDSPAQAQKICDALNATDLCVEAC